MAKPTLARPKRAAIYARVSTDGQTTDNQLQELRAVAGRMGWEIVHEFIDNGVSGAKGRDQRPRFDALCKAAIRREFESIGRINALFGKSIEYPQVIKQSSTGASAWCRGNVRFRGPGQRSGAHRECLLRVGIGRSRLVKPDSVCPVGYRLSQLTDGWNG
jgi:hypothetical protein